MQSSYLPEEEIMGSGCCAGERRCGRGESYTLQRLHCNFSVKGTAGCYTRSRCIRCGEVVA